jgi:hypothetical protein
VAVPLNGPGGRIAILELKKGGRLPDGPLAAFFNTCKVLDFAWDPFNNRRLAVGMATDHLFLFIIVNLIDFFLAQLATTDGFAFGK